MLGSRFLKARGTKGTSETLKPSINQTGVSFTVGPNKGFGLPLGTTPRGTNSTPL